MTSAVPFREKETLETVDPCFSVLFCNLEHFTNFLLSPALIESVKKLHVSGIYTKDKISMETLFMESDFCHIHRAPLFL